MRISIPIEKTEEGTYKLAEPDSNVLKPALELLSNHRGAATIVLETNKTKPGGRLFECIINIRWGGFASSRPNYLTWIKGNIDRVLAETYNWLLHSYDFHHPWQVDEVEYLELPKPFKAPMSEADMSSKLRADGFSQNQIDAAMEYFRDNDIVI